MRAVLALLVFTCAYAQQAPPWRLTQSHHFDVYAQTDDRSARSTLNWFEQLRAFFVQQTGLKLDDSPPVRVIVFRSQNEYQPYRLRGNTDAYYVAYGSRNYIVLSAADPGGLHVAAHEYAHLILHASGLQKPLWLNEGLSEFFSTVEISTHGSTLGGDIPANSQLLQHSTWLPMTEVLTSTDETRPSDDRQKTALYYAQCWALTEMLMLSQEYGPHLHDLISSLTLGTASLEAFQTILKKSPAAITTDLQSWEAGRTRLSAVSFPAVTSAGVSVEVSAVSPFASRAMLADLLQAAGQLDRAEALYRDLAKEASSAPDPHAALGAIALRRGDLTTARLEWKQAIDRGIADAKLCFEYAVLAENAELPPAEIRPVLERAIALKPDFDDARYKLALLEKNARHFDLAVTQLRAMVKVSPARAYPYWMAMADALNELDKREEAVAAAQHASMVAKTPEQRLRAAEIAYIAKTDLSVAFTRDENGQQHMVTTRIPHNTTDWNPFIELGDDIRRVQGTLRRVDCGDEMRIVVETTTERLTLAIPDPSRVQMINAPPDFVCGPQQEKKIVVVEYSVTGKKSDGVVRGLSFR